MLKIFKNKIFADPWVDLEKIEFNDINIDKILDIHKDSSRSERWMYDRSAWTINSVVEYQLVISEIASYEGSFYCFKES